MTTYYVDWAVGDDTNAGTSAGAGNAWKTISKSTASGVLVAGDKVYIKASASYLELINLSATATGGVGSPIIWEGYTSVPGDGGQVTIDGESLRSYCLYTYYSQRDWIFRNFRCVSSTGHAVSFGSADFCIWENITVENAGGPGIWVDDWHTLINIKISGCSGVGVRAGQLTHMHSAVLSGNTSTNLDMNSGYGAFVDCLFSGMTASGSIGALVDLSSANYFVNCTFDGENTASSKGITGIGWASYSVLSVINCSFYDWDIGIELDVPGGEIPQIHNCHFNSNGTDVVNTWTGRNNVTGPPLFTDEAAGDYTLQAASPLVGAGLDAGSVGGGTSYMDIGAYQRTGTPPDDTPPSPPPSGSLAIVGTTATATLNSVGEAGVTRKLEHRLKGSVGAWTVLDSTTVVTAGQTLTGTIDPADYELQLVDEDAAANRTIIGSRWSSSDVGTPAAASLVLGTISDTTIAVAHTRPSPLTDYSVTRFYYQKAGGSVQLNGTSSSDETINFTGLTPNTTYMIWAVTESTDGLIGPVSIPLLMTATLSGAGTTYRSRVQNALIDAVLTSTAFREVTYSPSSGDASVDTANYVVPVAAYSNEIRGVFNKPQISRLRGHQRERQVWTFDLLVLFDREVTVEEFEGSMESSPIVLARDANHSRQIVLKLQESNYEHPPNQDSGDGSKIRFVFAAEMSPL